MKIIKEYLIVTIICPEFFVLVLGVISFLFFQNQVELVSTQLQDTPEILKHIALLPCAMALWTFREIPKLLFPEENMDVLQEWPGYQKLKVNFHVSLVYVGVFAIIGLLVWISGLRVVEPQGFIFLVVSVVGASLVVVTTYLAKVREREILLSYKKK